MKRAFLACLSICLFSAPAHSDPNRVDNILVTEADDGQSALVVIESQQMLKYRVEQSNLPPEIVVHMLEDVACPAEPLQRVDKMLVQGIRSACETHAGALQPKPRLKSISIILNQPCTFSANQNAWVLSIGLRSGSSSTSAPAQRQSPAPRPVSATPYIPIADDDGFHEEIDLPARALAERSTLIDIVQAGLANHKPLAIAQKELKLAKRKLFEARRNFFPTLAARGSQSEGQTQSDPNDPLTIANFRRKEIGIEIGQPIFQSGRILFSERQASAQKEIAELEIGKMTQDVTYEIIRALYAYLSAREALSARRALAEDSQKILETMRRKKEIGVASESEYLGVLSAYKQLEYKALSQEKDMEIARMRLLSVLNVDRLPENLDISLESAMSAAPAINYEADVLLAMAAANRPEVRISRLNKKVREYARKVARGDYLFKVDASGFLGQSGAAFQSEQLTMKDSYNLGIKGTVYFGGSSVSPLIARDKTAPDLGSNSRTETRAESINIGILDSLGAGSNLMQASIDEEKAAEENRRMKRDLAMDVKEALFNYQKAKLQLDSARGEMDYRRKELEITRAKDKLHQVEGTQLLQALTSMTEAQVALKETSSYYLISVAALEKAIGSKLPNRI